MKSKYLGNDVLPCYLTKPLLCADDVYSFFTMELSAFFYEGNDCYVFKLIFNLFRRDNWGNFI